MRLVRVAVPLPVHGLYTYAVPDSFPELGPGAAVRVPFGARAIHAWVIEVAAESDVDAPKPIERVLDDAPAFDAHQLALYRFVAEYWLAPLGEVIAAATPSGTHTGTRHVYRPTEAGIAVLATDDAPEGAVAVLLREVVSRPGLTRGSLERRLHAEVEHVDRALARAMEHGWVEAADVEVAETRDRERWAVLVGDPAAAGLSPRATRAAEVLAALAGGPKLTSELDGAAVRRLVKAGVVVVEERPRSAAWMRLPARDRPPELNDEQRAAVEAVGGSAAGGVGTWLLHGVTGAGKTEVYLALAAKALAQGRQVLVLVPEIALTPQLLARFAARFGDRIAALHSALTGAERVREWRRIASGAADIAVGARSAVFAPFHNLGLVVVDEENDDSYKQEEGVRYHARDVAVVRGRIARCPVVLGSATPSLESWENARSGRYTLVRLTRRATPRPVPRLEIVDMREEPRAEGREPLLSAKVRAAVAEALAADGKVILLHNRRGYATFVECPGCGQVHDCPSCGVALVYHQAVARLHCHYCGFHRSFTPKCGRCGSDVDVYGRGTERVEEAVAAAFPGVPIGRMDADTTATRGAHARILDNFREGRTRLLVGTQIVAKGHDFPDVHVAAVLGADHVLGLPDFRSAERTFALVTQLSGRAGRGNVPGRVFLQTHHPDHPVFGAVGDMEAFVATEERIRRMLGYPPWSRLALVRFEGVDRAATEESARAFAALARQQATGVPGVDVLGPALAALPRLVGRWRVQVILRGRLVNPFRRFLSEHHTGWKTGHGVRRIIDVDPRSLA